MIETLKLKAAEADGAGRDGWAKVDAQVLDSEDLSVFANGTFSHSYTNFSIFFFHDPPKAAAEIHRTLKTLGGTALVTSWAGLGYVPLLQRAQQAVRPDEPVWPGPVPQVWMRSEKVEGDVDCGGI